MADAVNAYEATLVGDQLSGDDKWIGGVLAADGNIYGVPSNATQVLRINSPADLLEWYLVALYWYNATNTLLAQYEFGRLVKSFSS